MANVLKDALKSTGSRVSGEKEATASLVVDNQKQGSRNGTKAITVHFPAEVRSLLKELAGKQGRYADDMVAEALNMLFVKYGKPEIAPRKSAD